MLPIDVQQVLQVVSIVVLSYVLGSMLLTQLIVRRWRRQQEAERHYLDWLDAESKKIRQEEPPQ